MFGACKIWPFRNAAVEVLAGLMEPPGKGPRMAGAFSNDLRERGSERGDLGGSRGRGNPYPALLNVASSAPCRNFRREADKGRRDLGEWL